MPWTITESSTPRTPVKPPGEPVVWRDVPSKTWVWFVAREAYGFKFSSAILEIDSKSMCVQPDKYCIPCPSDWRFEARVIDGTLRFVPLVEGEREEFDITCTENIGAGELVKCENGTWFVGSCVSAPVPLTNGGRSRRFRRPRGPVTLTYTPPDR